MTIIENNWDEIKNAILQTFYLISSFGYSGETLSSNNALIPIAYYFFINNDISYSKITSEDKIKIKKWLISSLLKKVFSGQPDNILRPIREIIKANPSEFPIGKIADKFKGTNKSIQFTQDDINEFLLNLQYGKSDTLSTLMLLYPSLDFNNKFHMDHIYPKSKFTKKYLLKQGVAENDIEYYLNTVNNIANLQLLSAQINVEKLAMNFDEWFNKFLKTDTDKISFKKVNYIPDMDYSYINYPIFINDRRKLLKEELEKLLL